MTVVQHRGRAADTRLPLFALCRRWIVLALFALGFVAALVGGAGAGPASLRSIAYSGAAGGNGRNLAQLVPPGNTPSASAAGRDITVTWAASSLTGGTAA